LAKKVEATKLQFVELRAFEGAETYDLEMRLK
jgi:hypothetical protein